MVTFIEDLREYFSSGGLVMPPMVLLTLLLWYALGYRYAVMLSAGEGGGKNSSVRKLIETYASGKWRHARTLIEKAVVRAFELESLGVTPVRKYLDDSFAQIERELSRYQVLIKTVVSIAPLLGLLGTVGGMIETFDSLRDMELFSQTGGIAGGISQALVTTQFGLTVAIPGLVINGYLNRKKSRIEMDLAQIKDLMSVRQAQLKTG